MAVDECCNSVIVDFGAPTQTRLNGRSAVGQRGDDVLVDLKSPKEGLFVDELIVVVQKHCGVVHWTEPQRRDPHRAMVVHIL